MKVKEKDYIQIGELAKMLDVTTRTIRYYEEIGLMSPPKRLTGRVRVYNENDIVRLKFILKLKELGISLKNMQELASIYQVDGTPDNFMTLIPRLLEILDSHISIIDEKIAKVTSLRQEICGYRTRIVQYGKEDSEEV